MGQGSDSFLLYGIVSNYFSHLPGSSFFLINIPSIVLMAIHGLRLGLSFNLYTDPKPFGNFINIILLVKMSTKITASEREFRLQGCFER